MILKKKKKNPIFHFFGNLWLIQSNVSKIHIDVVNYSVFEITFQDINLFGCGSCFILLPLALLTKNGFLW